MEQPLSGWGNHPVERCHVTRPESVEALQEIVARGSCTDYIARGLGRAYGDSAINGGRGVIVQTLLDRFVAFDERTGVLECEAGVSIEAIIHYLLPRGWFVPTTPGTKHVTIGGAIAADIHGKNHHADGSFGSYVDELRLLLADGSIATCTPSGPLRDLFWATVGGFGLTGIILSAKVRLMKIETSYFEVRYVRGKNLEETLRNLHATNDQYRYSVAWVDCLARGSSLGRSVLMLSNGADVDRLPEKIRRRPLEVREPLKAIVPIQLPSFVLNPYSLRAFNTAFYAAHPDKTAFVDYDAYYYPLDRVLHWNRVYGKRGFVQYQALFPHATADRGLEALLERVATSRRASFLGVLKTSGPANPSPLSYLFEGLTLALDLPFTSDLPALATELDRILLEHGGRLYLAKDTLTTKEAFRAMYPRLPELVRIKERVDPNRRFVSSQARRVGIV
jgi:FAD/FMN-containing dehydrogenase